MTVGSILITGASTGIGEACARHFDGLGWEVFAGVRRPEDAVRLTTQSSGRLRSLHLDVADMASIEGAIEEVAGGLGDDGLTAVVNNAGLALGGPVEYLGLDTWRRQFEVNVIGQVAVTKAVMPMIRRSAWPGRIVFMGSIAGRLASPLLAPYAASKHAIEAIAESMGHELAGSGIRVVVIEPGAVQTPLLDKNLSLMDRLEETLPADGLVRYRPTIAAVRRVMRLQVRTGVRPERVAQVVERAVTSARPARRYVVGSDARGIAMAARFLPDRSRDAATRAGLRLLAR